MILVAGLTPAWQQIVQFDRFETGQVNRARAVHWCASGKVLNVGIALHHLSAPARTISVLGGPNGEAIRAEFKRELIDCAWVSTQVPTRVCTTILDSATGRTTELVENSSPLEPDVLDRFVGTIQEQAAAAGIIVLSGSLPDGTPADYYRRLLEETTGPAILDIRGPELLAALVRRPLVVKPNRHELERTVSRELNDDEALLAAMRELNARGAEWVIVTGGGGPVWATSRDRTYQLRPAPAMVVNPIACGDCLAAGIAWGVCQGWTMIESVRYGMGAAADNLQQLLPSRLDPGRVAEFAQQVNVVEHR
jgi:1-phosphofructokinase family hexose kinase